MGEEAKGNLAGGGDGVDTSLQSQANLLTRREKLRLEGTQDTVAKCNRGGWTAFKVLLSVHEETRLGSEN